MNMFDQQAADYDAWYDTPAGAAAFGAEVATLRPLVAGLPRPWLEAGVGSGRFASAIGIEYGIDPARGALQFARRRGVRVVAARGEALPFRSATFGAVLLVVTLCFVDDPARVLGEAHRVLGKGGAVVVGTIPAESSLGRHYQNLAAQGHPYYSRARFFTRSDLNDLLRESGFREPQARSALLGVADWEHGDIAVIDTDDPRAGFVALAAKR